MIEHFGEEMCSRVRGEYPRIDEIPFDSDRKLMSTVHRINGQVTMLTKGAVDVMLDRITQIEENGVVRPITEADRKKIITMNVEYSERGMRVLCFGKKAAEDKIDVEDERDYIFMGLCAMTDPPREESKGAVEDCKRAA